MGSSDDCHVLRIEVERRAVDERRRRCGDFRTSFSRDVWNIGRTESGSYSVELVGQILERGSNRWVVVWEERHFPKFGSRYVKWWLVLYFWTLPASPSPNRYSTKPLVIVALFERWHKDFLFPFLPSLFCNCFTSTVRMYLR
ncbi:hypothetical protein VTK73DRAFT_6639 [Phialemonium thermophilum]|uniref:Uncharacterized protein n=1 Tax=Phialemonium thermophilum TaxID=223376 RepID=A0ABR3XWH5_9PEZI